MFESQLDNPIVLSARLVLQGKRDQTSMMADAFFLSARMIPRNAMMRVLDA
jgi:hypothetical protein